MSTDSSINVPLLAIVGRPNVGKSALFNRLVGRRQALVEDLPGTTRDRLYGEGEWVGRAFRVVDTGGLETEGEGPFSQLIRRQIELALAEADAILFVVDARDGITAADLDIAELLRRATAPVLLVANKADNDRRVDDTAQFYELGAGEPVPISAFHGLGVADLLDRVFELVPAVEGGAEESALRVAIVGRPNVGKSALLNAVAGDERMIVSDIPGTTRDVIDTTIEWAGNRITLLDTAGIRRAGRIERGVERHSVQRAREALERADVALCVMDVTEPAKAQDVHIVGMAAEANVGVVLVMNKIDLLEEREAAESRLMRIMQSRLKFVPWARVAFVSALARDGLQDLLQRAVEVGDERARRIPTAEVNAVVRHAVVEHAPRTVQGKRLKVLYATQAGIEPPTFVLFVNDRELLHFAYERYLENRLRDAFGFEGTAIKLVFKSRIPTDIEEQPRARTGAATTTGEARPAVRRTPRPRKATT